MDVFDFPSFFNTIWYTKKTRRFFPFFKIFVYHLVYKNPQHFFSTSFLYTKMVYNLYTIWYTKILKKNPAGNTPVISLISLASHCGRNISGIPRAHESVAPRCAAQIFSKRRCQTYKSKKVSRRPGLGRAGVREAPAA